MHALQRKIPVYASVICTLVFAVTVSKRETCFFMSPLRRHTFVCFMAKSAFLGGFSVLAPYTGVGPIECLDEICSVPPPLHTLKIWGAGVYSPRR